MKPLTGLLAGLLLPALTLAQTAPIPAAVPQSTTSTAPADDLNFDEFGDADDKKVRLFATQKVLFLSPTKLISVGYEAQTPFDITSVGAHSIPASSVPRPGGASTLTQQVNRFSGLRLGLNAPVISRSNFILNLGLTYWNTGVGMTTPEQSRLFGALDQGLRSTGINATVFKPLDLKHFLLIQANADLNGTYQNLSEIDSRGLTYSGTAIYGWKPSDNLMWGLGVTRTYRAGQVLHIPVVFYNQTFNPRWGVEAVFPAKANLRRNFGTSGLLMLGYEIEGNAYFLGNTSTPQDLYLRRGELKPRITYERKLAGFIWLSAQAGVRYNWRFDVFDTQNPTAGETPRFSNTLGTAPYVNISLNLVSP